MHSAVGGTAANIAATELSDRCKESMHLYEEFEEFARKEVVDIVDKLAAELWMPSRTSSRSFGKEDTFVDVNGRS